LRSVEQKHANGEHRWDEQKIQPVPEPRPAEARQVPGLSPSEARPFPPKETEYIDKDNADHN